MLSGLTAVSEIDGLPVKKINFGQPRRVRLQGREVSPPYPTLPTHKAFHAITVLASHLEVFIPSKRAHASFRHPFTKSLLTRWVQGHVADRSREGTKDR
jgi:hypothetical protein